MTWKQWKDEESGVSAVLVALCMVVLVTCLAFAVDLGSSYVTKVRLQTAVDNAALAAGYRLPVEVGTTDQGALEHVVYNVLEENGINTSSVSVDFNYGTASGYTRQVRVTAETTVQYVFAQVMGFMQGDVSATALSKAQALNTTNNASSIYITQIDFEAQVPSLQPGQLISMDISSTGSTTSNFAKTGIIRIPSSDQGQSTLSVGEVCKIENSANVYSGVHADIQERIDRCHAQCGWSCTWNNHSANCPRVLVLPVVTAGNSESDRSEAMARSTATVRYFVAAYLEDITVKKKEGTIMLRFLDDYRETGGAAPNVDVSTNPFIVCTPAIEE